MTENKGAGSTGKVVGLFASPKSIVSVQKLYAVTMKTLSVTQGRQNLGAWLKRALRGEDVGFLVDGRVVALRPVEVHSEDCVLQEYAVSEKQGERAYQSVNVEVRKARRTTPNEPFTGNL